MGKYIKTNNKGKDSQKIDVDHLMGQAVVKKEIRWRQPVRDKKKKTKSVTIAFTSLEVEKKPFG